MFSLQLYLPCMSDKEERVKVHVCSHSHRTGFTIYRQEVTVAIDLLLSPCFPCIRCKSQFELVKHFGIISQPGRKIFFVLLEEPLNSNIKIEHKTAARQSYTVAPSVANAETLYVTRATVVVFVSWDSMTRHLFLKNCLFSPKKNFLIVILIVLIFPSNQRALNLDFCTFE